MSVATATAREQVMDMLRRLPDDVTMEDIEYHVSFMVAVQEGARAVEEGRFVTQAEAEERLLGCRSR